MAEKLQAPRGTFDVLPEDGEPRLALHAATRDVLERAGYGYFESPVFEDTEVFARGVGESTDIVSKEMFTFEDKARALADAAARGHRGRVPRVRRARHAQAARSP